MSAENVPRIALRVPGEAAVALGISEDSFNRYVRDHIRLVRAGTMILAPTSELERWALENAEKVLGGR